MVGGMGRHIEGEGLEHEMNTSHEVEREREKNDDNKVEGTYSIFRSPSTARPFTGCLCCSSNASWNTWCADGPESKSMSASMMMIFKLFCYGCDVCCMGMRRCQGRKGPFVDRLLVRFRKRLKQQ